MKLVNSGIKWVAQLAVALSAGVLVIIFLSANPHVSAFLLRILVLIAVAFMAGFCGRLFFKAFPALGVTIMTLVTNLISMLIIDHFYHSPYQFGFIMRPFSLRPPGISDISQALLLLLISFFPLLLFRNNHRKKAHKKITLPNWKTVWMRFTQGVNTWLRPIHPKNWGVWRKMQGLKKKSPRGAAQRVAIQVKTPARSNPTIKVSTKQAAIKPTAKSAKLKQAGRLKIPGRLFGKAAQDVKLMGEEEHVCPYCLDVVNKNDGRGVKICQECGTWHHQDCWDLTGACGVAHRNEL